MRILIAAAALLTLAAPAAAQSPNRLTLADPASAPSGRTIIDGASCSCDEAGQCVANGGRSQPATRACRRAVARLGPVTAFAWKGTELDAAQLAECNAAA